MQTTDAIQAEQLQILKARLTSEGIPFTEGKMIDVFIAVTFKDDPNFQEDCLIVNGWCVNYDRWGFVMDKPKHEPFFDNGGLDEVVEYIRSTVLPQPQ